MYSGIYDKNPKRFYEIRIDDNEAKSRIQQKGQRENLLCGECESKLSLYEKYADENLYGKNQQGEARLINQSMDRERKVFLYEFEAFDYDRMKLFLDSLLWRLLVSETIYTPDYGEEIKEQLRNSIYTETPLDPAEFPCLVHSIMTAPGKMLKGFILSPLERKYQNRTILSVLIDGFEFNFYMTDNLPEDEIIPFLQRNGELKVLGRLIYDMPELVEIVKQRMDHLRERLHEK
jgi:hypothetical protein